MKMKFRLTIEKLKFKKMWLVQTEWGIELILSIYKC